MSESKRLLGGAVLILLGIAGIFTGPIPAVKGDLAGREGTLPEGVGPVAVYRTLGVLDAAQTEPPAVYASVVHCSNHGLSNASISLEIRNKEGNLDCTISDVLIPPTQTRTLATRDTATFTESFLCTAPPTVEQGSAVVFANPLGSTDVSCTFQVLDAVNNPPTFLYTLDLYDGEGRLLPDFSIFVDGFESGDTSAWS